MKRQQERRPPADRSVTSLYVAGVPPSVGKKELLPYFMPYGEVREISVDTRRLAALVTFRARAAAEEACAALYGNLTISGSRLRVMWPRKRGRADTEGGGGSGGGGRAAGLHDYYGDGAKQPPPPPPPSLPAHSGAPHKARPTVKLPPGVRPPPGVKHGAPPTCGSVPPPPGAARPPYPSMDPSALGTRPERE